jgi:hypothetical protein
MTNDSYRAALEDSKHKLRKLVSQREEIHKEIVKVQTAIVANANMLDDPEDTSAELSEMTEIVMPTGLTDAVRSVLQNAGLGGLTPVDVRQALVASNFDLSAYSNPLSAIHTVLKRLVKKSEAKIGPASGGETVYQWIANDYVAMNPGVLARRLKAARERLEKK